MSMRRREFFGYLLGLATVAASFVVPEGRRLLGLDPREVTTSPPVAPSPEVTATVTASPPSEEPSVTPKPEPKPVPSSYYFSHRKEYTGQVWIHITPAPGNEGKRHTVHIVWGSVERKGTFWIDESLSLLHDKTKPDSVTMDVHVDPAARVEFGEGAPPRGTATENIHKGWDQRA